MVTFKKNQKLLKMAKFQRVLKRLFYGNENN